MCLAIICEGLPTWLRRITIIIRCLIPILKALVIVIPLLRYLRYTTNCFGRFVTILIPLDWIVKSLFLSLKLLITIFLPLVTIFLPLIRIVIGLVFSFSCLITIFYTFSLSSDAL